MVHGYINMINMIYKDSFVHDILVILLHCYVSFFYRGLRIPMYSDVCFNSTLASSLSCPAFATTKVVW